MNANAWAVQPLAQAAVQRWKNGGGATRELLRWPARSPDWQIRISVADIECDGAFSRFDQVQRWFAVLSGELVLDIEGHAKHLSPASAPITFDGSARTHCRLLEARSQDFNLMLAHGVSGELRRGAWAGLRTASEDAPELIAAFAYSSSGSAVFDTESQCEIAPLSLAWRWLTAPGPLALRGESLLWLHARFV